MIPLQKWLSEKASVPAVPVMAEADCLTAAVLDIAAERAKAFAEGEKAGRRLAEHELRQEWQEERAALLAQSEDAQRHLRKEVASRLAEQIADGLSATEQRIAAAMASALKPVLSARMLAQASSEFTAAVAGYMAANPAAAITVTVPVELQDAVRAALDGRGVHVPVNAAPGVECVAAAAEGGIESCLAPWLRALGGDGDG